MPTCTASNGPAISPARPASNAPSAEHDRIEKTDIDTERPHHLAMRRAGAHQHAEARLVDEEIQSHRRPADSTAMMARR